MRSPVCLRAPGPEDRGAFLAAVGASQRLHRPFIAAPATSIQPVNRASIALVRACGFRQEGYSPRYLKIGGRWRDHERWAILAT